MINWRIWYEDGTCFDSSNGAPAEAPNLGVICITNHDPDESGSGKNTQTGYDFFVWDENHKRWFGADFQGLLDWCFRTGLVKWGRYTSTANYREILYRATHDPDFKGKPPKSHHQFLEQKIKPRNYRS